MGEAYKQITASGTEQPTATWVLAGSRVIVGMVVQSTCTGVVGVSTSGSSTTSKTAYTEGSGNNRIIMVTISDENNNNTPTVSGISWGGENLIFIDGRSGGTGSNDTRVELWYLPESQIVTAGAGPHNFTVTWNTGPVDELFTAITLQDVDQTNPVSDSDVGVTSGGGSTTATLDNAVSTDVGDMVFYAAESNSNSVTHSEPGSYTELNDFTGSGHSHADAYIQVACPGTEQSTATWDASVREQIVAGVVNYYADPALPVEFLSFSGRPEGDLVRLQWSTAWEQDNAFFTIHRSSDGFSFESIGTLNGAGNSSVEMNYEFFDERPYHGLGYYRIKQTDFDGAFDYSKLVSVVTEICGESEDILLSPNPVAGRRLTVSKRNCWSEVHSIPIIVTDLMGRVLFHDEIRANSNFEFEMQLGKHAFLSSGVYFLKFQVENRNYTRRFIVGH